MFHLYGVTNFENSYLSEQLEDNLKSVFSWGFLEAGAFSDVRIPTSGIDGGDFSRLRRSSDDAYDAGRIWEGVRKDWVWETGLSYHADPIHFSGIFVNNSFKPATGTGPFAFHVDYPNGRVIFDTAIAVGSTVKAEYSFRTCSFMTASEFSSLYRKEIQFDTLKVEDTHVLQYGSGNWDSTPGQRIQLPTVIIDATPSTRRTPRQLGNLQSAVAQRVTLHLLSQNNSNYKRIHDALTYQSETTVLMFDKNAAIAATGYGLDFNGSPHPTTQTYPNLVRSVNDGGFLWKKLIFENINSNGAYYNFPLVYCPIDAICSVYIP